jgi:iron(III) transport system permease protein
VAGLLLIAFSIFALWLSARVLKGKDYATLQRGGGVLRKRRLAGWARVAAYAWIALVLLVVLSPHVGILLLSLSRVWSFSVLPERFTLEHYATVFHDATGMIGNTLLYCGLAASLDVVLGTAIAYLIVRTRMPGRRALDLVATAALAVPGLVLAIGYLRVFRGVQMPVTGGALTASWLLIAVAYAVRRLPYALRACMAALQQIHVSLEEAAENLGASRWPTVRRVVLPLMVGGMLAGFVTSFITAAVELSATIVLVSAQGDAPMSYGIYLYLQSIAGRGPGAALGVIAVAIVAIGTWLTHVIVNRQPGAAPAEPMG